MKLRTLSVIALIVVLVGIDAFLWGRSQAPQERWVKLSLVETGFEMSSDGNTKWAKFVFSFDVGELHANENLDLVCRVPGDVDRVDWWHYSIDYRQAHTFWREMEEEAYEQECHAEIRTESGKVLATSDKWFRLKVPPVDEFPSEAKPTPKPPPGSDS